MDPTVKEQLLALAAVRTKVLTIDGVKFTVREASAQAFADYGAALSEGKRNVATALLLQACVVDDDGAPLLTAEEAATIAGTSRVARLVVAAVSDLSGFGPQKEPDAG